VAEKTWEVIKIRYCHHVNTDVGLEAEVVYPADIFPDPAPRVQAHRCTHAFGCNLDDRSSCVWAGTNPAIDPFTQPL
jgi:hypothetical protein